MKPDRGTPIKVSKNFRDFIDNVRCTRRSKVSSVDTKLLTQSETTDLLVNYFKFSNDRFKELIQMEFKNG